MEIAFAWIEQLDLALVNGHIIRDGNNPTAVINVKGNDFFDNPGGGRESGSAKTFFHLESVILRRIVAGGDHDARAGFRFPDRPGNGRRRGVLFRQTHTDTVACGNFGHSAGKIPRHEPAIITDYQTLAPQPFPVQIIHRGLCHNGKIVKGEIAGNNAAPAVRTKLDLHCPSHHL